MLASTRKSVHAVNNAPRKRCQECKCTDKTDFLWEEPMFGKELDKDAQIWETYVEQTERSDKEVVKEWNDSLDAALFSAVTTSLVLESLRQLQPDPVVQELLTLSHILLAAPEERRAVSYAVSRPPSSQSTPSGTSVLINALWFLSLGLSVVVSLAAMLAKGWCNEFMAHRTGTKYEQGRKRQLKWDGIESWGMQRMFLYLPTLMHLAILLFGIGLAMYLWTINIKVAIPIVVLSSISTLLYIIATILPRIYSNCPYSTPFSESLVPSGIHRQASMLGRWLRNLARLSTNGLWRVAQSPRIVIYKIAHELLGLCEDSPPLNNPTSSVQKANENNQPTCHRSSSHSSEIIHEVSLAQPRTESPMDTIDCHILRWLIQYCEEERMVDTALLSMAGASRELPRAPLVEAHILELICSRLSAHFVEALRKDSVCNNSYALSRVLLYTRAFLWLSTSDSDYGLGFDRWSDQSKKKYNGYSARLPNNTLADFFHRFRAYLYEIESTDTLVIDPHLAAITASIVIPTAHYYGGSQRPMSGAWAETPLGWFSPIGARNLSIRLIQRHVDGVELLHNSALLALLQATPHWMIETLNTMDDDAKSTPIILLVKLLRKCAHADIELRHAIGLSLTVAAIILHPMYPSMKRYTAAPEGIQARLVDIYSYHTIHRYRDSQSLLVFGLLGLLQEQCFNDSQIVLISEALKQIESFTDVPQHIHTLPESFTFRRQCGQLVLHHIRAAQENKSKYSNASIAKLLEPVYATVTPSEGKIFAFVLSLTCDLSDPKYAELQKICFQALNFGDLFPSSSNRLTGSLNLLAQPELLDRLLQLSLSDGDKHIITFAMVYVWKMTERLIQQESQRGSRKSWALGGPYFPDAPQDSTRAQLTRLLGATAHVALRKTVPNLPAFPRHIYQTGLADKWYPLLVKLSVKRTTAEDVIASGIVCAMIYSLDGNEAAHGTPHCVELQDGKGWRMKLEELRRPSWAVQLC
ncbi:transmembrane protein [Ceratobasidium sp. AG-Ba]|nr:transmembrane protein [Ceratobasidium sp. AG-Ba]